jgi:hypothetical protein
MRPVYVEWKDSVLFSQWLDSKELRENIRQNSTMRSIGFLTEESDEFIFISQSIFNSKRGNSLKIPRACVERIIEISLPIVALTVLTLISLCSTAFFTRSYLVAVGKDIRDHFMAGVVHNKP